MEDNNEQTIVPGGDSSLYFHKNTIRNCVAAWLFPGAGYSLAGRRRNALIISIALVVAYLLGATLGGDLYNLSLSAPEGRIRFFGAVCQAGMGFLYFVAKLFMERGTPLSPTYDYGTSYFLIAGMINWLVVLDVFDISVKRK